MARTSPVTATTRGLQKVRAAYGAALVLVPGPVIWLATGQLPSRRACRVAQVLGIRHLAQAALTAAAPEPAVLAIGGQVDAVHAASMLLLASVSRAGRRAALTDALTEAALAAAGFSASKGWFGRPSADYYRGGRVSAGLSRAFDRREFAGQ
jgi:hypothetical protein